MKTLPILKREALFHLFVLFISTNAWAAAGSNWIEQWGITWTFDKNISLDGSSQTYQYGQYVNGDYWIVGPVKIVSVSPPCIETGSRIINGSMINPIPSNRQSYDSGASDWLPKFNVGLGIDSEHPLFIDVSDAPVKSVVSTISTETVPSKRSSPRLQTAAVLTVVSSAPSVDAFRPPYAGSSKPAEIRKASIDWNVLGKLPLVQSTPSLSESERDFERCWLVHKGPYPAEVIQPIDNMPGYGRTVARRVGIAALQLNLEYTREEKEVLLVRLLQYGIDVYGIADCKESLVPEYCSYTPQRIWYGTGGIGIGKRTALVFAAKVLNHAGMIETLSKQGDYLWDCTDPNGYPAPYGPGRENFPPDYIQFGEEQVFYVRQLHVDLTHNAAAPGWPLWSPDSRNEKTTPYTAGDVGLPEWGVRAAEKPETANNHWFIQYRSITGGPQVSSALALRIIGAIDICNHDAWFDYYDRYMTFIQETGFSYELNGQIVTPFASAKPWRFGVDGPDLYVGVPFVWNMWLTYRANYGPIWPETKAQTEDGVSGICLETNETTLL